MCLIRGYKAVHMLSADDYAESVEGQQERSWVLLGEKPPAAPPAAAPLALTLTTPAPQATTPGPSTEAAATAGRRDKGKNKALPMAVAARSSRDAPGESAGSSHDHAKKRAREPATVEAAPAALPAIDIGSLSAAQLAELQVRIAQQLQATPR